MPRILDSPQMDPSQLAVCERCAQVHRWHRLAPRAVAHCTRCGAVLGRGHKMELQPLLALTVAAFVVMCIANTMPLISIRLGGAHHSTSFLAAIGHAWNHGEAWVAAIAVITALVAPGVFIGLRLYLLIPMAMGQQPPGFAPCVRWLHHLSKWNTVEVLGVAALLSQVRMAAMADVTPGPGIYALGALSLLLAALQSAGLRHLWWHVP